MSKEIVLLVSQPIWVLCLMVFRLFRFKLNDFIYMICSIFKWGSVFLIMAQIDRLFSIPHFIIICISWDMLWLLDLILRGIINIKGNKRC